jgi:predicted dehydrogenase
MSNLETYLSTLSLNYHPRFPEHYRPGIGIIGGGTIVRIGHMPAYTKYNQRVIGIYDPNPQAISDLQKEFEVGQVFGSVDELLAHPEVEVVDIATHPAVRADLIRRALEAGKPVLSQKPLAVDVATARSLVALAEERKLKFAVNQNGRFAPAWRIATLLIEQGAIGEVMAITHLFDRKFSWIPGTAFDNLEHFAIYDYAIHWIDISRLWFGERSVESVRAHDYRVPNQPDNSKGDWGMWIDITYDGGYNAHIRSIGAVETSRHGHPFWVHGSEGTIRGSILGNDWLELERDGQFHRFELEGTWFPDGFGGTMAELLAAISENREPSNSASHNLRSLELTLAACASADRDGQPMTLDGDQS